MNSNEFVGCLRKADDSPEVARLLVVLGVKKKLKMPKDDIEARVDLPKAGLSLIFKPQGPKTSKLALVAVQFLSDAEKGFTSFRGELPGGLQFSETQPEVREKLGRPTESKKEFRLDRWKRDGLVLTVEYSKGGEVSLVSFHAPEYY